ncbi:MAG: hypothetical protein FWC32_00240, partial [Firmicutes bacterium]|nr:hypothetical protein [Bacillota bacterium]
MKKVILAAVVLILAIALAACGNNNGGAAETPADPAPPANNQPADTTPPADPAPPTGGNDDNGGLDIANLTHREFFDSDLEGFLDYHFPATDLGGITLRWVGFGNPYHYNEVNAARYQERRERVERRFNVNLEFIEGDDIVAIAGAWGDVPDVMVASIAAGDPIAHLWRGNAGYWFPVLANGGHLRSMDSYLRANLPASFYSYLGESATGVAYGFNFGPAYAWNIFTYNRDMIRGVGMEMTPSEMFMAGRWSLEDFYEYVVQLNALLPAEVTAVGMHENWWMRMAVYANGG